MRSFIMRLIRAPMLHFLLLGSGLFGLHAWVNPTPLGLDKRIVVDADTVLRLRQLAVRQWGVPPTPLQMQALVQDYVREEVLYRAALAKGFDQDDEMIRRRLVQKMEFLAHDHVELPQEADIAHYYSSHPEAFLKPARVDVAQIYFNPVRPGLRDEATAMKTAQNLREKLNQSPMNESELNKLGDSSLLPRWLKAADESRLTQDFGRAAAATILSLPEGQWSAPVATPLGLHLFRVSKRHPPEAESLAAVREKIVTLLTNQRLNDARAAAYQAVLQDYEVQWPTLMSTPSLTSMPSRVAQP